MNSCSSVIARNLHQFPPGGNYLSGTGKFTYARKECGQPPSIPVSAMYDVWHASFVRQHQARLLNPPSPHGVVRKSGIRKQGTHITRAYGLFCAGMQRTLTALGCQRSPALNAQYPLLVQSPKKSSRKFWLKPLTAPNLSYGWLQNSGFEQGKSRNYAQITSQPPPRASGTSPSKEKAAGSESFLFLPSWQQCCAEDLTRSIHSGFSQAELMDTYLPGTSANSPPGHSPAAGRFTHCGTASRPLDIRPLMTCFQFDRPSATPACKPPRATPRQTQQH